MKRYKNELFKGVILEPQTIELMISQESFAPGTNYGPGLNVLFSDDPVNIFGTTLIWMERSESGDSNTVVLPAGL